MPTYQYACTACDHRFEAVQSFSEDSLSECPVCGGALRKVFSSVGIVFKGSGFYRTDNRGSGSGVAASSPDSSSSDSKSDTKTDSKSDSKSSGPRQGELVKTSGGSSSSSSSGSAGSGSSPAA